MKTTRLFEGVEFRETTLLSSGLSDVKDIMDCDENAIIFDDERILFDVDMGFYVIAYSNSQQRDIDRKLFEKAFLNIEPKNELMSMKFCGEFEYKGKYCILVSIEQTKEGETNNYLYKGFVVNPKLLIDNGSVEISESSDELVKRMKSELVDNFNE